MKRVWTAVARSALALSAVVLSACSSGKACCAKPGCERVWIPPRAMTSVCYETVPAETREARVGEYGTCRRAIVGPANSPIVEDRVVVDRCTAKVPTYEWECSPTMGYRRVEDRADRICPTYGMRCKPVTEKVHVLSLGLGWDCRCGPRAYASLKKECRTVVKPVCVKTGEQLVSLPAGSHLEQVQVSQGAVRVPVGEHDESAVTGRHVESDVTGLDKTPVVYDYAYEVRSKGHHPETREVRPVRYHGVERQVTLPGFWARICDDPSESNGADVITRAEYEEYLKDARRN